MDTNTIIEGTVKFRDGKKWKSRWCVVRKLSPVADCIHLQLYRDSKERYKHGQTKASLSLENFLGIQSGFTVDKESNTLAIICQEVIVVLAFDTREHLMQWQVKITSNLGEGDQFLVQISSAPSRAKLAAGPARLLIQEYQFCLTVGVPPRLISFWQITHLRRFGVVEGKFCFEGGSRCGRGEGLYVLVSEKPEELTRAFHLAAEGKLFTRKRPVARNMSVMEKVRKHHTLRPESQLSDVSSLNSTIIESQQGSESNKTCGSCSQSHEDLLSWPLHFPDTMSTCEGHRFDLKPFWSSEVGIGRCTSCMSKLGSMSRSSTLTNTPGSCFPAWTMDRPKSCGSGKMSSSVTCSSISLSSHSSRGSSGGNDLSNRQHLPATDSSSCACRSVCASTPQTPPSRPPKPAHLSLLRLQATPVKECPSPSTPSSPHTCCCAHPATSPYGNYDVPKPLSVSRSKLRLDLKSSPVRSCSTPLSVVEFYDTPRKIKDSLNWDYGNYDIPPPAQPVSPTSSQNSNKPSSRESMDSLETLAKLKESLTLKFSEDEEIPQFQINKVKLTGEGRMPVMSPCGKIIERPEPTYEEKLESLLENDCLSTDTNKPNSLYANITPTKNCPDVTDRPKENLDSSLNVSSEQNYSNIELIQSLENYENFKCFLPEQNSANTISQEIESNNRLEVKEENHNSPQTVYCSKCAHTCTINENNTDIYLNFNPSDSSKPLQNQNELVGSHHCPTPQNQENECIKQKIINSKCNSTSCLQEIKSESLNLNEKNEKNKIHYEVKTIPRLSNSVTNSPDLKRITRLSPKDGSISARFYHLSLRKRSNSADSARLHLNDESIHDSTDSHDKSRVLSNPSSTDSLCAIEKIEDSETSQKKEDYLEQDFKLSPLIISEKEDLTENEGPQDKTVKRHFDTICARRSASVPNKFFSNRDSSSSNDSGVSTGSLSLKHFGPDFLEFEMPLTTSMSSKRHHIAVLNGHISSNGEIKHPVPKRSKSVDPLRDLAFTFEIGDQQNGKSTSAEAEVPMFLLENNKSKDYLSPQTTGVLPDSRSTSSGTSDMSDYFETLSFSSFSSLDGHDNLRNGRASIPTMKPRSGKEYHKIDRYFLEQETKE